jgi:small subunit ribosomal protein S6
MTTAAAAPATKWAREYETIYILRPDVDNDVAEKVIDRARDVIKRLDGTLTKLDNWGKRKLAYPIQKNTRGIFVYLKYVGFSDLVAELERNLGLLDEVVRFQTVLLQEDVDPASIAVDPDEVQYLHVEEEEEAEDAELERARSLGMAPRAPRETSDDQGSDDESDMSGSDDDDDTDDDDDADSSNDGDTNDDDDSREED